MVEQGLLSLAEVRALAVVEQTLGTGDYLVIAR
jgi:hypothetical protein